MELYKVMSLVILSSILLNVNSNSCPQLQIPHIVDNKLEVKDGSTHGLFEIEIPGLQLKSVKLWVTERSNEESLEAKYIYVMIKPIGDSNFVTNLPKDGKGILAMKPNLKKIGSSTYKFSVSVPGGNYSLYCNIALTNLCGDFRVNMKIENDMSDILQPYPIKVTEYPKKEYIVEEEGDEIVLKFQGDVLDHSQLGTFFRTTQWYPMLLMKGGYLSAVHDKRYQHLKDNFKESSTPYNEKKTARTVFKEMKIKLIEDFEGYICLDTALQENFYITVSSCSTIILKKTLGTGVHNIWVHTCSQIQGYQLSTTDSTPIPLPRDEMDCIRILATGHPAPHLIFKKGSKYFNVPQDRISIATFMGIPTDGSNDYIGEYEISAGYSRIEKTMKFKTIPFTRVKVTNEFHDDAEKFYMTCTAVGDPLPHFKLYTTKYTYYHYYNYNGTFEFQSDGVESMKKTFQNARAIESQNKISLILEKEDIKKYFKLTDTYNMFGVGCVGQNEYSNDFKFHYFHRLENNTIIYDSEASEPMYS